MKDVSFYGLLRSLGIVIEDVVAGAKEVYLLPKERMNMYSSIMRAAVSVFPLVVGLFSFLVENIHIVIPPGDSSLYCLDCIYQ